jgi:sigma-B regulation protein RsbU (phosphoserine phosphatase)
MESSKPCIMLVDDEPNIVNALRRELAEWADGRSLEILTAHSAKEALKLLESRGSSTSLVISDLKMPEMKGSDFLLTVKSLYPEITTILLTGFTDAEELIKAVSAGIFGFMLKPWDHSYLLAEVQKAWEHGETKRENLRYLKMVEDELRWAGEMQKTILKPNLPRSDKVEFRASYNPVPGLYCGGDYYDVIFLSQDRYLLLIGDVAGHGVKAAFVTGILKAVIYPEYVRTTIGKDFSPGAFLAWLNNRMCFEFRSTSDMLITFFAGVLDLGNMTLTLANAGHNLPFLMRDGVPTELSAKGPGIGMLKSVSYQESQVPIAAGDRLVLYTDGLVEIACHEGKEPVSLPRLLAALAPGDKGHRSLMDAALAEAAAKEFTDDVTIVSANIV